MVRRLFRSSRGVSYSLPLLFVVPITLAISLSAVEVTQLLIVRFGVQLAAHRAARTASLYVGLEHPELVQRQTERSAWATMSAYADGGLIRQQDGLSVPPDADTLAQSYGEAVGRVLNDRNRPGSDTAMARRFRVAAARSTIQLTRSEALVTVTLTYRARLIMPGASRWLDPDRRAPFEYPLTVTVLRNREPDISELSP